VSAWLIGLNVLGQIQASCECIPYFVFKYD
jgi:hypothetical protein